jgi:putative ABC transport system substrate-binding protein
MSPAEGDAEGQARIAAFRQGLAELGWAEGRNLEMQIRWAGSDAARVRQFAAELVALAPDLIVVNGSTELAALKQATQSIPIVFAIVNDPVGQGLIASLAHPGGNITGFTFLEFSIFGKSLELLRQVAPRVTRVAFMFNPETVTYRDDLLKTLQPASEPTLVALFSAPVHDDAGIEATLAKLGAEPGGGLIAPADSFNLVHRQMILQAAARHRVPGIYSYRQFVREGGLMSYAPDGADIFRRSAAYVDRILKGAKPADLPAQSPEKFELGINLVTAKALGLTVPANVLALADEVVE